MLDAPIYFHFYLISATAESWFVFMLNLLPNFLLLLYKQCVHHKNVFIWKNCLKERSPFEKGNRNDFRIVPGEFSKSYTKADFIHKKFD